MEGEGPWAHKGGGVLVRDELRGESWGRGGESLGMDGLRRGSLWGGAPSGGWALSARRPWSRDKESWRVVVGMEERNLGAWDWVQRGGPVLGAQPHPPCSWS